MGTMLKDIRVCYNIVFTYTFFVYDIVCFNISYLSMMGYSDIYRIEMIVSLITDNCIKLCHFQYY